jgi:hypothetical protein
MIRPRFAAALLVLMLGAGALPATAAVLPAPEPAPATPADELLCDSIDPGSCLFPFPNNHFTKADSSTDTGLRLALNPLSMPRNAAGKPMEPTELNRNDGFSPGQSIVTKVPGLDTPEAFAKTNPVSLTNVKRSFDPAAPIVVLNADTGRRHLIWSELDANAATPADTALIIRPAVNFEEGARYIVALRNLKDASGATIQAQPAFAAFRDGTASGPRAERYQEIFSTLRRAGVARKSLYLAWDFTVASERNLTERMLSIRDDAFAQLGDSNLADLKVEGRSPAYTVSKVTDFSPEQNAQIARRVEGTVTVPCYLNAPGCPTGSQFLYGGPSATVPVRLPGNTYNAKFTCNIPRGAEGQRFRPSLYGHGLMGSGSQVNSGKLYDLGANGLMFCGADWIGMSSEDIPNAAVILADLSRFPSLADRVQQGMLNFLYIGRALIHPEGFSAAPAFQIGGQSVINTKRLYYNGGSQGGIIGGALTAVAPDFTRGALGVPAMNYSTLLERSVDFDTYALIMYNAYRNELERPLLFSLVQVLWDRAESNGYAHHMTDDPLPNTPRHEVLMHEAFGDHQVTNWATEVMARTVGVSMRKPAVDPGRHPAGKHAYAGIPTIGQYPFRGSALVVGEIGPLRSCPPEGAKCRGTTPPPVENVPNRPGVDPHGPDFSETVDGKRQIARFLRPAGRVVAVCGSGPCYLDGWTGPQR